MPDTIKRAADLQRGDRIMLRVLQTTRAPNGNLEIWTDPAIEDVTPDEPFTLADGAT